MAATIQVHIKGIDEVNKFLISLPKNLSKALNREKIDFLKRVRKSAKLRAPRFTGKLADSIKVIGTEKQKEARLVVESPYGIFQEEGFRPHWVELRRSTRAGGVIADWAAQKGISGQTGSIFVSKFTPFIKPALEKNLSELAQRLNIIVKDAIKKSGG